MATPAAALQAIRPAAVAGTLPFTGAELALYVVIGLAIVASGLALRAYSARRVS